ncbi:hypothetical protein [Nocardia wallacei]|uniref:hypothetical protein n=1 Tax=Nocardia wallacei TaxID=480035 RepID=UPI0024555E03|nr:hypothetical protein [Nocardia wallacei]
MRVPGAGGPAGYWPRHPPRFFRLPPAAAGGSGLGLPIAAALVKARQGSLRIEPVHPHGLAVTVELPAAAPS